MDINFNKVSPISFQYRKSQDSLWGNEIVCKKGEIYQILAPSGSGKSTLISILAGLRGDYKGNVIVDEKKMSSFKKKDWSVWRSRDISFVFQDLRLFPELTSLENVELLLEINKTRTQSKSFDSKKYFNEFGISDKTKVLSKFLSYGQQQRVAIIRAISKHYSWLVLDEPFSHLDNKNAQIAWQLIKSDAQEKNAGIIITSLDPYPFISPDKIFFL